MADAKRDPSRESTKRAVSRESTKKSASRESTKREASRESTKKQTSKEELDEVSQGISLTMDDEMSEDELDWFEEDAETKTLPKDSTGVKKKVKRIKYKKKPINIICPFCEEEGKTRVKYVTGSYQHGTAVLLAICCCLLCAVMPYCSKNCSDVKHFCPECNAYLGIWEKKC